MAPILKKATLGIILAVMSLLCSGCWDVWEVDQRIFVAALGIESAGDGIIKVSALTPEPMSTGDKGLKVDSSGKTLLSVEAETISDCFVELAGVSERRIDWGLTDAVVISEQLARKGIDGFIEFLINMPNFPLNARMYISRQNPSETLNHLPKNSTPWYLSLYADNSVEYAPNSRISALWEVSAAIKNRIQDPTIAHIDATAGKPYIQGQCILRGDRVVGTIQPDLSRFLVWSFKGSNHGGYLQYKYNGKKVALAMVSITTSITPEVTKESDEWSLKVKTDIKIKAVMLEPSINLKWAARQELAPYCRAGEEDYERKFGQMLKIVGRHRCDVLGIYRKLRLSNPALSLEHISQALPSASLSTSVNISIDKLGVSR